MLDPMDMELVEQAKAQGAVFVTFDMAVRKFYHLPSPIEVMEQADKQGKGSPEAHKEIKGMITLKPENLTVLRDAGDKTWKLFMGTIKIDQLDAENIKFRRTNLEYSWRAIARFYSTKWGKFFGNNQIAGMCICKKAAEMLGEDFMQPPWN